MVTHPRNKFVVAAVAFLCASILTSVAVMLNTMALTGAVGFLVRAAGLVGGVAVVLVGFNALCDRCQPELTDADEATTSRSGGKRIEPEKARLTIPIELRGRFRAAGGGGVTRWVGQ